MLRQTLQLAGSRGFLQASRFQIAYLSSLNNQRDASSSSAGPIDNVLIIGSGLMGSGIAQSCAQSKHSFASIVLQDVQQTALDNARNKMLTNLTRLKQKNSKERINSTILGQYPIFPLQAPFLTNLLNHFHVFEKKVRLMSKKSFQKLRFHKKLNQNVVKIC